MNLSQGGLSLTAVFKAWSLGDGALVGERASLGNNDGLGPSSCEVL